MESRGYKIKEMNGCVWEEKRKQVSHVKTEMGRILKKDNEVRTACAHVYPCMQMCAHVCNIDITYMILRHLCLKQ